MILPPSAFDPPVTKDGNYSPAFLKLIEELVAAANGGTSDGEEETPLEITGSGWIAVDETDAGFDIHERMGLTTSNLTEGTRRYANHTSVAYDFAADAGVVLDSDYYRNAFLEMTDSGTVLTTGQDVTFPESFPLLMFKNSTAQTLTLKKDGGTGVTVAAGATAVIAPGLTDVEKN